MLRYARNGNASFPALRRSHWIVQHDFEIYWEPYAFEGLSSPPGRLKDDESVDTLLLAFPAPTFN